MTSLLLILCVLTVCSTRFRHYLTFVLISFDLLNMFAPLLDIYWRCLTCVDALLRFFFWHALSLTRFAVFWTYLMLCDICRHAFLFEFGPFWCMFRHLFEICLTLFYLCFHVLILTLSTSYIYFMMLMTYIINQSVANHACQNVKSVSKHVTQIMIKCKKLQKSTMHDTKT